MASRIKVDEVTNLGGSGTVSFPTGGASFGGNVTVSGDVNFTGNLLRRRNVGRFSGYNFNRLCGY